MCNQEWNDHDRSKKTLARDLAKDYLESCPKNAILFSFGDNDTYPLWYAQEVEGIRPDVRVMVNTLLSSDWYMNQMRYKINESAPFDVIFTPEADHGRPAKSGLLSMTKCPDLIPINTMTCTISCKNVVASDDPKYTATAETGNQSIWSPPTISPFPVDLNAARSNGIVHPGDSVVSELHIDIPADRRYLLKNDLAMLAVIATTKWQRPVCFTSLQELGQLGLMKYARLRGLAYQLVPVENPNTRNADAVDNDAAYQTIMEKFAYGDAATPGCLLR